MTRRSVGIVAAGLLSVAMAGALATRWSVGPFRRTLESRLNAQLEGYRLTIGRVGVGLIGLSVTLYDVTVAQDARPASPVAFVPEWRTSVQWRALLAGALVADVQVRRPQVFITLDQATQESADAVPMAKRGWQDAVEASYPLEINAFDVEDGTLSYYEPGRRRPLQLTDVAFRANNIRNVRSNADRYPSPVSLRCRVLGTGALSADGSADFLARPMPRVRVHFEAGSLPLKEIAPAARHAHLDVRRGELTATGRLEYSGSSNSVEIDELTVARLEADYEYQATPTEVRKVRRVVRTATVPETAPRTAIEIARARIEARDLGVIDRTAEGPYRLFLRPATLELRGFSNRRASTRKALAHADGWFMGSGRTTIDATFAPGRRPAEFGIAVQIEGVDLTAMNDLLRARGGFDVAAGSLSVYAEARVLEGRVSGYVKPLFAGVDVYDRRQERGKGPLHQLYEALVGGTVEVLTNRSRDEVATITDLSGPVDDPDTSVFDIVVGLLQNAFIKAILPGLERRRARDQP